MGKSALLDAVAREYEKVGAAVVRCGPAVGLDTLDWGSVGSDKPVLVDDAHRLDPAVLGRLSVLADTDGARLVVAYRPWPRSSGLSALGASLVRRQSEGHTRWRPQKTTPRTWQTEQATTELPGKCGSWSIDTPTRAPLRFSPRHAAATKP